MSKSKDGQAGGDGRGSAGARGLEMKSSMSRKGASESGRGRLADLIASLP